MGGITIHECGDSNSNKTQILFKAVKCFLSSHCTKAAKGHRQEKKKKIQGGEGYTGNELWTDEGITVLWSVRVYSIQPQKAAIANNRVMIYGWE